MRDFALARANAFLQPRPIRTEEEKSMAQRLSLTAKDGHNFPAYRADPQGKPRGAIVVIQEVFGVNHHIRSVVDRFGDLGYFAIAPAVFDRIEKEFEVGYDEAALATAVAVRKKASVDDMLMDVEATIDYARQFGRVAMVGYCMGGSLTFQATARLDGLVCGIGYYGAAIAANVALRPKVPCMLHFGDRDHSIPMADVEKIKATHPDLPIHVYHAEHGFNCDERAAFNPAAAQVAFGRTIEFMLRHLG
jgi:carboxymethylenebutenolidase